ncbi:MAG: toll/interleukin-1 receptor domain-containing protein [Pseudomonadota bacterium]
MSTLFISHSSRDNDYAKRLLAFLQRENYESTFLDVESIDGGEKWEDSIYEHLGRCRAVIALCSKESLDSKWCLAEIIIARSKGKIVIPIRIRGASVEGSILSDTHYLDADALGWDETCARLLRRLRDDEIDLSWKKGDTLYPGLEAFQLEDAGVFVGRDPEIREARDWLNSLRRTGTPRWAFIQGASGSGKSSLLQAGILPRLARSGAGEKDWLVLNPFRPGSNPVRSFVGTLATHPPGNELPIANLRNLIAHPDTDQAIQGLSDLFDEMRRAAGRKDATVLISIDQFEELLGEGVANAALFLSRLRKLTKDPSERVLVLGTIRSDFLGVFLRHPVAEDLGQIATFPLGPIPMERVPEIIERPAALAGVRLEAGLTQRIIFDMKSSQALPLLAFTLNRLYEGYGREDGVLEIKEYATQLKGLHGAVEAAAEEAWSECTRLAGKARGVQEAKLSDEDEHMLREAFLAMVQMGEENQHVRRPAVWDQLPERARTLLEPFVKARLLTHPSVNEGTPVSVEIAHEALFQEWDQLGTWLDEERAFLVWRRRLSRDLEDYPDELLKGPRLREARRWARTHSASLSAPEQHYIQKSHGQRLRKAMGASVGMLMLLALGVGLFLGSRSDWYQVYAIRQDAPNLFNGSEINTQASWLATASLVSGLEIESHVADPDARDLALGGVARARAQARDPLAARAAAAQIGDPFTRAEALNGIVAALAQAADMTSARAVAVQARAVAERIESPILRASALRDITKALITAGDAPAARATAAQIEVPTTRASALHDVTRALVQIGNIPAARATAAQIEDPATRASALGDIAIALVQAGEASAARTVAAQTHTAVEQIEDPRHRNFSLRKVAEILAQAGDTRAAIAAAMQIKDLSDRAFTLFELASVLAQAGNAPVARDVATQARAVAERIEDSEDRAYAQNVFVGVMVQAGDTSTAIAVAMQIEDPENRTSALRVIAVTLARVGETSAARTVAAQIEDPENRAEALRTIAVTLAEAGDAPAARAVAAQIEDPENRASALRSVALNQVGDAPAAIATAEQITDPTIRASTLSRVARALAQAGDMTTARAAAAGARTAVALGGTSALSSVAIALAWVGDAPAAIATAEQIKDPGVRASAFSSLVQPLSEASELGAISSQLLDEVKALPSSNHRRSQAFSQIAKLYAQRHQYRLAREAASHATIPDDRLKAYTAILAEYSIQRDPSLAPALECTESLLGRESCATN